jgi:hypothetical protein
MVEQTSKEQEGQQSDSGRISTHRGGRQTMATLLGHQNNNRSGRQDLRGAGTVIMSDKQKYRLVEDLRLDTWAFVAFFVIMGLIAFTG